MRAYVGYSTSLLYWLQHGTDVPCYSRVANIKSLTNATYSLQDLQELDLESLGLTTSEPHGCPAEGKLPKSHCARGLYSTCLCPKESTTIPSKASSDIAGRRIFRMAAFAG